MKIEYLKDSKGANRFGTCNNCGISADEEPWMRRLKFNSVSICLCNRCFNEVKNQIQEESK